MLESISGLLSGFSVALQWDNFLYCFAGCFLGTIVGILPGLGPLATITILMPITMYLEPTLGIIMMAGIYYGACAGGSNTAIMLRVPGETSAVVLCLDGYAMTQKGRGGAAMAMAAIGNFSGAFLGVIILAMVAPSVARLALEIMSPEYTALLIMALVMVAVLTSKKNATGGIGMALIGLLISTVGTDVNWGVNRYTFGIRDLSRGVSVIAVAAGFFALTEVIKSIKDDPDKGIRCKARMRDMIPTSDDLKKGIAPAIRGTLLGSVLGILPGIGPGVASFMDYSMEKSISKDSNFGNGCVAGVVGPEAATNSSAFTHFIPMLTLGIPASATFALMMSALTMHGIEVGPTLMTKHPDMFWGLIASMFIGNLILIIFNVPMIGVWMKLMEIPYRILYPIIIVLCALGVYMENLSGFDLVLCAIAMTFAFVLSNYGISQVPLLMGLVLGDMLESNLHRTLLLSESGISAIFQSPIAVVLLAIAVAIIVIAPMTSKRSAEGRKKLIGDDLASQVDLEDDEAE